MLKALCIVVNLQRILYLEHFNSLQLAVLAINQ